MLFYMTNTTNTGCPYGCVGFADADSRCDTCNAAHEAVTNLPKCQQWRGLGRAAYRAGTTASGAVTYARKYVTHDLDACEQALVMAGWRDERSDTAE